MTIIEAKRRIMGITGCSDMDARCILIGLIDRGSWILTPDRRIVRAGNRELT